MDKGHRYADAILEKIAEQIAKQFQMTTKRAIEKLKKYLKKHKTFIDDLNRQYEDGEINQREYNSIMVNKLTTGKEWEKVRDEIADDYCVTTDQALAGVGALLASVYIYNRNFSNETTEWIMKQERNRVVRLPRIHRHHDILPHKPNESVNQRWHRRRIESVIRREMRQGKSIDEIARTLQYVSGMDVKTAYRNARTGVTSAECQARIDSYEDAEAMGIEMEKQWYATKDNRTRKSHRVIDGERVGIHEYFSNGLYAPGDPDGDPSEVYNCRCTLLGVPDGVDLLSIPKAPEGMGRYEWIGQKPTSKPFPEE